ncbi:hypothetical protein ICL81_04585 [Leucobacter sp. cx-328]|uniref:hypothetical protein n=1 Tax=unclassified Leucobacter TaxID=2621730 RepID=UPI00165D839A|nr:MULTISPECIES: hypothetical protein [unclassified Leucobacter]MBC9943803.1 hypothetical protein [Leucobacter sp. cx-328]
MKNNTLLVSGIVAGLIGMSLIPVAAHAEVVQQNCDGLERLVCSAGPGGMIRVTNPADTLDEGTLRTAIAQANASPGLDEIVIDAELNILVKSRLVVTGGVILRGEGAGDTRPTITRDYLGSGEFLQFEGPASPEFVVQLDNLQLTGLLDTDEGIYVGEDVQQFGLYDSSLQGFGRSGIYLPDPDSLEYFIVDNSDFSDMGPGDAVLDFQAEDLYTEVHIHNSRFTDNQMTALNIGSTLTFEPGRRSSVHVSGSAFLRNTIPDENAGAISILGVDAVSEDGTPYVLEEPLVHLEGNLFRENSGEEAGAIFVDNVYGGESIGDGGTANVGDLVLVERSSFVDNVATGQNSSVNDLAIPSGGIESDGTAGERCPTRPNILRLQNSTFSSSTEIGVALSLERSSCADYVFEHTTFVGAGIDAGSGVNSTVQLTNTVIDTGEQQPITMHAGRPEMAMTVVEDHVAYSTEPTDIPEPGVSGARVVASSDELALGDLEEVAVDVDGLQYTAAVHVPGLIDQADPLSISKLVGAASDSVDARLATDQRGLERPQADPVNTVELADIGAVEAVFAEAPVDPVEPVDPVDPVKPVDPVVPTEPVDTAKPVGGKPVALAATGVVNGPNQWIAFGAVMLLAGGALIASRRLGRK